MDFLIDYSYDDEGKRWMVTISGEVDIFNSAELKKKLTELIAEKEADLYLNCKNLEYIDSTTLGVLVGVLKNVKHYDGEMHLMNVKPNLAKLFKITNLDKVFILEGDNNA